MRIIFSRDRPAQLDLLLRSIDKHMRWHEDTRVIWHASTDGFSAGYALVTGDDPETDFESSLRDALSMADVTVSFFCDDDIVFREVPVHPATPLWNERILSVALCLGQGNVKQELPPGFPVWEWDALERHDFGYPCGIDGNTYRTADAIRLIGSDRIDNPTSLETVMAMRARVFEEERPLMSCFLDQCVVGVPVNRVSETSGVPYGRVFSQTTAMMNERFLAGERIDLDALDFSDVNSVHHEIEFVWK